MTRGMGRVFRRGKFWWIAYSKGGKEYRESSRSIKRSDAVALLKKRNEAKFVASRVKLSEILHDRLSDAKLRGNRSIRHFPRYHRKLLSFFGDVPARDIVTPDIRRYQGVRLQEGAACATINREVASLSKALRLAVQSGLLVQCPPIPPRLQESEPRQGFFEHGEYLAIRAELEPWAQDVLDMAYYTGWRRGEILGLKWDEVFIEPEGGTIRLRPDRTKTRRARVRPITEEIAPVIRRRIRERVLSCQHVFHRGGKRIPAATWHWYWNQGRKAAGLEHILFHDARRTVARNLVRAGVREGVAMAMTGHVTRHIFDRYNIVNEDDLAEAARKLKVYVNGRNTTAKVVQLSQRFRNRKHD